MTLSDTQPPELIKVMIVDDHPMVAEGIQSILESYDDINVVGCLPNGRAAIEHYTRIKSVYVETGDVEAPY